jgi:hypothetical protein
LYPFGEDNTLHRTSLGKSVIALIGCSGLVLAGDLTLDLTAGVRIANGVFLNCSEINCNGATHGYAFVGTLSAALAAEAAAAKSTTSAGESNFSTTFNSGITLQRLAPASQDAGAAAVSTGSPSFSNMSASSPDTFILNGTQVIGEAASTSRSPSVAVQYSNPIVSSSFNSNSTAIASNGELDEGPPAVTAAVVSNAAGASASDASHFGGSSIDAMNVPTPAAEVVVPVSTSVNFGSTSVGADAAVTNAISNVAATWPTTGNMDTPEPSTELLIGAGLIAAGVFARVKRQAKR